MSNELAPEVVEKRVGADHAALEFLVRVTTALTTRTYVSAAEFAEVLDAAPRDVGRMFGELRRSERSALRCVDERGPSVKPKYRFEVERGEP